MNERSVIPGEYRISINLGQIQQNNCFISNNGKKFSRKEKPINTPIHCSRRQVWVVANYFKLNSPYCSIAYLTESLFTQQIVDNQ